MLHRVSDTIRLDIQARYADYEREKRITEPLLNPVPPAGTPPEQISVYRYVFAGSSDETLPHDASRGALRPRRRPCAACARRRASSCRRETVRAAVRFRHRRAGHEPARSRFVAAVHAPRRSTRAIIADTESETAALFALDTLKLSDAWHVTLGARWDRFDADVRRGPIRRPADAVQHRHGERRESRTRRSTRLRAIVPRVVYKPVGDGERVSRGQHVVQSRRRRACRI